MDYEQYNKQSFDIASHVDWFLVKTKEGKEGYIHKSRIKSPKS
ncbi:hypothetical protein [Chryseobacterium bernardetii]